MAVREMLTLATLIYEHPLIAALGPELSAYLAGFAVPSLLGEPQLTPLGEEYLASLEEAHD